MDGGNVGRDRLARSLHEDDGVCRIDEVAIAVTHKLPELLFLVLDLLPSSSFHIPDLGNGFCTEEGFSITVAHGGEAVVVSVGRRYHPHA